MDKQIDPWKSKLAFRLMKAAANGLKVRYIPIKIISSPKWTVGIGDGNLASRVQTGRRCLNDTE